MSSDNKTKPKREGIEKMIPNFIALFRLSLAFLFSFFFNWLERIGNNAVLIAIPKTPRGN